jgi:hypothetical protein
MACESAPGLFSEPRRHVSTSLSPESITGKLPSGGLRLDVSQIRRPRESAVVPEIALVGGGTGGGIGFEANPIHPESFHRPVQIPVFEAPASSLGDQRI